MARDRRYQGQDGLTRRQVLLAGGGTLAGLAVGQRMFVARADALPGAWSRYDQRADPFTLGVASGDPLPDGVVLWTRLAPDPLAGGGLPPGPVAVEWQVADDEPFVRIVRRGVALALPDLAHSVHVEVGGLEPRPLVLVPVPGRSPPEPRRAGPAPPPPPTRALAGFTFAFASCQDWQNGFFTAYDDMAAPGPRPGRVPGRLHLRVRARGQDRPGAAPGRVHEGPEVD